MKVRGFKNKKKGKILQTTFESLVRESFFSPSFFYPQFRSIENMCVCVFVERNEGKRARVEKKCFLKVIFIVNGILYFSANIKSFSVNINI